MTSTQGREPANTPLPSPFPEGWYFVVTRQALRKAGLIRKTWMGETIVAWSDDEGRVCVAESSCPHLGSDLGPAAGGCVRAGRLVCPFHGFEYDAAGRCVATPFADPPKTARLRVFETHEVAGLIFAWWGIDGREPQWGLPVEQPEQNGWSRMAIKTLRFPGHPQETTENSVDLAHLRYVHGYDSVSRADKLLVDGHYLESRFDFRRTRSIGKIARLTFDVSAYTRIYGLGYSFVEIREHSIGMDMRLWVLATPVDGAFIDMSLVSQVREIRAPKRRVAGLGFLPPRLRAPVMNRFIIAMQERDVLQDVLIWSRKRYRSRPRLARSDGEIMRFRAYCAQFYPSLSETERPIPSEPDAASVQGARV
ncbi:MAG: Rieske 2Fe-2S domain-containing protein [Chloroflexota bacterium]|nr:Rieske 2Fe-2S domain-containing protein [Chloroflexota bacterium]